ncbi:collagen binding domain-containing protein [Nocardioides sp. CFH 31398]|uniref:MSCRAMM family protein n=1 Tax=Nocardioides sp. CFH 31398 TaxID=2919579 RepID=UPI001F05A321|nr:carboxypeptidase-like regulatory domain-containing protein [Nocardioides sp. CFH 31398]MCH1866222.1 carboxypeptidase-like regulatory domain-containing protein [Nocardioides sp. CFH 31398]
MRTDQPGRGALVTIVLGLVPTVVALLMSALVVTAAPAQAAGPTGGVRGAIVGLGDSAADLTWAGTDGTRSGTRRVTGGVYSLDLAPGTYRLTVSDRRPTYDVTKRAPSTVEVTVVAGRTVQRTVRLVQGAAIGGTVRAGGKVAPRARVVAARKDQTVFTTTADSSGGYALGGLPAGAYSVFTYDAKGGWTAKSLYLPRLRAGAYKPVDIALATRAGTLLVDVFAGDSRASGDGWATAVSARTGQFWVTRMRGGSYTFTGLYPGRYRVIVPGSGNYLGTTATLRKEVRPGRPAFDSVQLTERGASLRGTLVDANRPDAPLEDGQVQLMDARGTVLASATTDENGAFRLGGQLTTRTDLRIVVGPGPYSPYLGRGTSYCKYDDLTVAPVAVRTGQETVLGRLGLPHLPDADQDGEQCHTTVPPSPTTTDEDPS